jgi:hypothetical protein
MDILPCYAISLFHIITVKRGIISAVLTLFFVLPIIYYYYTSQQFYGIVEPQDNRQSNNVVPKAEPCSLLSCNNDVTHGSAFGVQDYQFTEVTMQSIRELGEVLQSIHNRLLAEGYNMKDGELIKH